MTSRERKKNKGACEGGAKLRPIFKFPILLRWLTKHQCLAYIYWWLYEYFGFFFPVLHNEVIYLWEILLYVSSSLGEQLLTLSLATLQGLPLHQNELFLNVSSVLCANVLSFRAGTVTFLGFPFFPLEHTYYSCIVCMYQIDSNKLVFIENGIITLTADKVVGHILSWQ